MAKIKARIEHEDGERITFVSANDMNELVEKIIENQSYENWKTFLPKSDRPEGKARESGWYYYKDKYLINE
jgi:hypothetical protein